MSPETERALQAAVRAQPDDWARWLVYADWLTDHDDRRGKLVHLEHQLATAELSRDDRIELEWDIRRLCERYGEQWSLPPGVFTGFRLTQRHGFVVRAIWPRKRDFLQLLETLVAHPAGAVLGEVGLGEIGLGPEDIRKLASSEALRGVTRLHLACDPIGIEGLRALVDSENLRSLLELHLQHCRLGPQGASVLAGAQKLRSLTLLELEGNELGEEGERLLASSENLRGCEVRL